MTLLDSLLQISLASVLTAGVLQTNKAFHEALIQHRKALTISEEVLTPQDCEIQDDLYLNCKNRRYESPIIFYIG